MQLQIFILYYSKKDYHLSQSHKKNLESCLQFFLNELLVSQIPSVKKDDDCSEDVLELYFPYLLDCFNDLFLAPCSLHILFWSQISCYIYKQKANTLVETEKNYFSRDWWEENVNSADVIGHWVIGVGNASENASAYVSILPRHIQGNWYLY